MEIVGKTTINPILFYSVKLTGFTPIIVACLVFWNINIIDKNSFYGSTFMAIILFIIAMLFIIVSLTNLGSSTRVGIPNEETVLKKHGIFKISRNPIYVGMHLLNFSALMYCFDWILLFLTIYTIVIYHLIILGEERFLEQRFGEDYLHYKRTCRRYV